VSGCKWFSSAAFPIRLAIRVSMAFPIVLNRAIGLHAPGSEYLVVRRKIEVFSGVIVGTLYF
jgi:hypothetical protein